MSAIKLLIVILDGGSAEAFARADTPYLDSLAGESGFGILEARAPAPTITYGNHSCIMTGRLPGGPGGHGIVGNLFRDPATRNILNLDDFPPNDCLEAQTLFERLPVRGAAVCEPISRGAALVDPMMPYFKIPPLERDCVATERALEFIRNESPDFVAVNFLAVDAAGEIHGPQSLEYNRIISEADRHIKRMMEAWRRAAQSEIHLLVTADHGMHRLERVVDTAEKLRAGGVGAAVAASHRSAHVYLDDKTQLDAAREILESSGCFSSIMEALQLTSISMDHPRSGDLFVLAANGVELQKQGLKGSHGASTPEETTVPLIFHGGGWKAAVSRAGVDAEKLGLEDLAEIVLSLFAQS